MRADNDHGRHQPAPGSTLCRHEIRRGAAQTGLQVGDEVICGPEVPFNTGNSLPLAKIPLGTEVYNVELQAGRGGVLCRSAGTSASRPGLVPTTCRANSRRPP